MRGKKVLKFIPVFLLFLFSTGFTKTAEDSLLIILERSDLKAAVYNQLAEAVIEDSLDLSMFYAEEALKYATIENNTRELGVALFSIAEVYAYRYHLDSAVTYYNKALVKLKQTYDNYYISYTLNNLGWIYNTYGKYGKAIEHYLKSIQYLDPVKNKDDLANLYINIGNSYHFLGSYHTAINYFHKAVAIITHSEDKESLPVAYNGLGLSFKYLSNFDSAVFYYNNTLDLDKLSGNRFDQAVDYGNIGSLYFEWKQYDQAFHFHELAIKIYEDGGNRNDLSIAYNNIGEDYRALGNNDSSLFYLNKALEIDKETGIEQNMANRYNNIGDLYYDLKDFGKALIHYEEALRINRETGSLYNISLNLKNIAMVNSKTGHPEDAVKLLKESLGIARKIDSKVLVKSILESMVGLYQESGQYKVALNYHLEIDTINNSLFQEHTRQMLADLQTRYELDKKQKEIALLNSENKLRTQETRQYRTYTIIFAAALLLISGLLVVFFIQYNLRKKAYKKLVQKNRQLAVKDNLQAEELTGKKAELIPVRIKPGNGNGNHGELFEKLSHCLEKEKPFLQSDLTMKELAAQLQTNTHYLSEVINQRFGNNFTGLINEYRIREACKLLAEEEYDHLTIESIAREAGFNSKSAFNNAFKLITGLTPSYYKKSVNR